MHHLCTPVPAQPLLLVYPCERLGHSYLFAPVIDCLSHSHLCTCPWISHKIITGCNGMHRECKGGATENGTAGECDGSEASPF